MDKYLNKESLQAVLYRSFNELSTEAISDLTEVGTILYIDSEENIIEQGENSKDVYFLLFGRVIANIKNKYGELVLINEIPQGEFFGEMALMTGDDRAATITTIKDSTLLKVKGQDFEVLQDKHPSILKYLNRILIKRLKKSNLSSNDSVFQEICCVQLGALDSTHQSLNILREKLSNFSNTFILSKEIALENNVFLETDSTDTKRYKFTNWVHDLSYQYDYIVYFCNQLDLEWSELCLRQADRILLYVDKELSVLPTKLEKGIFKGKNIAAKIEKNLVVSWSKNESIAGTQKMLKHRQIKNVFHLTSEKDTDRLVRYLHGASIKLVLSGGGAKGFAHLGVYKAFVDLGIPIDFVGGTSAGSLMSATVAYGWDYEKIKTKSYHAFIKRNVFTDIHFPFVSFLKGKKFSGTLRSYFGDSQVEDLFIPFYAVASNFTNSEVEILDRGSLAFAVNASMSLPAILPPAVRGDSILLDGGLMDNLPIDHMNSLADGPVIGVDLSTGKKEDLELHEIPNNFTLLKQKIFGKKNSKVPSISQIMMRTMTLSSKDKVRSNEKKFDVYIKPDVSKFGFLQWNGFEEFIECGYNTAYPILKAWKKENKIGS